MLGIALLVSLVCALAVFLIEEFIFTAENVKFDEPPVLSETAVDINTASLEQLDSLDGVGEGTAKKIIEFRETVRPFETVKDLTLIKGFGEKKLEEILDSIYVK